MEFLLRNTDGSPELTLIMLGSFAILVVLKLLHQYQFEELIALVNNGKYLLLFNKRDRKLSFFNPLFYVFAVINLSVLFYLTIARLPFISVENPILIYIINILNIYFVAKYLIEKIVFETLDLTAFFEHFNFQRTTYNNLISLIIFAINILLIYIFPTPGTNLIYLCLAIVGLLYIINLVFLVISHLNYFLKYWFYFILYLCIFEISPILLGVFLLK